jgi:hypothetical protein
MESFLARTPRMMVTQSAGSNFFMNVSTWPTAVECADLRDGSCMQPTVFSLLE